MKCAEKKRRNWKRFYIFFLSLVLLLWQEGVDKFTQMRHRCFLMCECIFGLVCWSAEYRHDLTCRFLRDVVKPEFWLIFSSHQNRHWGQKTQISAKKEKYGRVSRYHGWVWHNSVLKEYLTAVLAAKLKALELKCYLNYLAKNILTLWFKRGCDWLHIFFLMVSL